MSSIEPRHSSSAPRRGAPSHRNLRGAVLMEAVLVVSILVLSLVGTVYVARIYQTALRAVAVSRAAAIGHSNDSCKGDAVAAAFSSDELALLTQTRGDESGPPGTPEVTNDAARKAISQATRSGTFGSPKLMSTTAGGEVFGPLSAAGSPGGAFFTRVQANDHVLCGEQEHQRSSLGVFGFARDFFKF